ncbi:MAG: DUF1285 domain-containing protein [Syntrophales bacterium]|jgi:hypothetical protein|nr:DUF1285 domain-containing protein [Syntrophales bacterium]
MAQTDTTTPRTDIRIDKDGVWFYRGQEMFRREIVNLFYEHLKQDERGEYIIDMGEDSCYVEVEDAPFVVRAVLTGPAERETSPVCLLLSLSDDTLEPLDPETIRIGDDNVMYCRVKGGTFRTRFSRAAYYQLAERIVYDAASERYELHVDQKRYTLQTPREKEN